LNNFFSNLVTKHYHLKITHLTYHPVITLFFKWHTCCKSRKCEVTEEEGFMTHRYRLSSLCKIIAFASIASFARADAPNPNEVYIANYQYTGNGCQNGSVATLLSGDAKVLTLLFDSFLVEARGGPWGGSTRMQKSCKVDIQLQVPQGYSYAIFNVNTRGFASLSNHDAEARLASRYAFGTRSLELGRVDMRGPYTGDYDSNRSAPLESLVWSACGENRMLTLTTDIEAKARSLARAMLTVDSVDASITQEYGIRWRTCTNPADHRQENERYVTGRCRAVLETIWGSDITDFWGQVQSVNASEAQRLSLDQAMSQCQARRNNNRLTKCTPVPGSCTAI
jgi:hypothetical protein